MRKVFTIIVASIFSLSVLTFLTTIPSEAVNSDATVDVTNPASGSLKFAESMPDDAKMVFTPIELDNSKSNSPLVQNEMTRGDAKVTLVDTRKHYPSKTQHTLSASMNDGQFSEYGMLGAKMTVTLNPQTSDPTIEVLPSVALSGERAELLTIMYRNNGLKDKVVILNPLLEIRDPSMLQLTTETTAIYGSQITWVLTPKI